MSDLVDYVYELKRMFPFATSDHDTFFETITGYKTLFLAIVRSSRKNDDAMSTACVDQIIEILSALIHLEIINLHGNEALTSFIIDRIVKE